MTFYWLKLIGSDFLLVIFALFALHSISSRKAVTKLRQEIQVRESAQAKNEELTDQILKTQKLDALGTLPAGIAHDFNNTLQAIAILTEVVKAIVDAQQDESLQPANSVSER